MLSRAVMSSMMMVSLAGAGCHRTKHYEGTVEVVRVAVVQRDDAGRAVSTDVDISYRECPGEQVELIRGGSEFSTCVAKLKVGDKVTVKVVHAWDPEGFYDHDVYELQGCKRPPDRHDEDSFKRIRQCSDRREHDAVVGFDCNYADRDDLAKKCPWFRRR
jgi:hypothetical protein